MVAQSLCRAPSAASVASEECDICFDAPLEVAIRGCGHQFCAPCLRGVRLVPEALSLQPAVAHPLSCMLRGGQLQQCSPIPAYNGVAGDARLTSTINKLSVSSACLAGVRSNSRQDAALPLLPAGARRCGPCGHQAGAPGQRRRCAGAQQGATADGPRRHLQRRHCGAAAIVLNKAPLMTGLDDICDAVIAAQGRELVQPSSPQLFILSSPPLLTASAAESHCGAAQGGAEPAADTVAGSPL